MPSDDSIFHAATREAVAGLPPSCRPWGRGWCAGVAGILEAAAAKPGNVHPGCSFPDLRFADLAAAATASAAVMEQAADQPLGTTILRAVRDSRGATRSNANLGIVLLLAPLAAIPDRMTPIAVEGVLSRLDEHDAVAIWEAIAIASPGGLGKSDRWDVAGPPPTDIRAAMRHAADRDTIARLWADGYAELFAGAVADLDAALAEALPLEQAIIRTHLRQLARTPDSLILRRHGAAVAEEVSRAARAVVDEESTSEWPAAVAAFDASLRQPRRLNPGTTADLLAAALYILIRDGRVRPALPFATPPFPIV